MKAAVLREVNTPLRIEEVQVDHPGPREVLILTGATGVCHSDLHFLEGKYSLPMPAVLGHEASGTVEAVRRPRILRQAGRSCHHLPFGVLRPLPHVFERPP